MGAMHRVEVAEIGLGRGGELRGGGQHRSVGGAESIGTVAVAAAIIVRTVLVEIAESDELLIRPANQEKGEPVDALTVHEAVPVAPEAPCGIGGRHLPVGIARGLGLDPGKAEGEAEIGGKTRFSPFRRRLPAASQAKPHQQYRKYLSHGPKNQWNRMNPAGSTPGW